MICDGTEFREWCLKCWNGMEELPYKKLTAAEFNGLFFEAKGCAEYFAVYVDGGIPCGFAGGDYCAESGIGYLTFVYVVPERRREGIGRALAGYIEERIKADAGDANKRTDIMFNNPVHLPWFIPGRAPHDHPCAPGVDMSSGGYLFAKNIGYRDYATMNSYYMPLAKFTMPVGFFEKEAALRESGIEVTYYDGNVHSGFAEFFDALSNEGWRKAVLSNLDKPVLVAVKDGKVVGYTGPLSIDASGRGNFCGIGVRPDIRGGGAGKALFFRLCEGLRDMGADFMSLYTGEENPARNIYEAAGFKIVRSWSCMRRFERH